MTQLVVIVVLVIRIKKLFTGNIKGVQYPTDLRNSIEFDRENKQLKYFYEPKANIKKQENPDWLGYTVVNTINSDSLNERYDYSIQKKPDIYRILTLGDSYTYGQWVDTTENYSELLEDALNNILKCESIKHFEVINLGVGGYDIEYCVERFKKRGIKYDPDLVIWYIHDGMFIRMNEYRLPLMRKSTEEGVLDFDSKTGVYVASKITQEIIFKKYGKSEIGRYQSKELQEMDILFKENLGIEARMLIITAPITSKYYDIIKSFANKSNNYYFYDKVFDFYDKESYRLIDGHPNKEGHKKISEDMFNYLKKNFFSNCKINK